MRDTCEPKECHLLRKVLKEKNPKGCPNYIETWWQSAEGGNPILVKDCCPRRMILMSQEIVNGSLRLQQANEKMRNKAGRVLDILDEAMQKASLQDGFLPAKQIEGGGIPS